MSTKSHLSEAVRRTLTSPSRGVVGLVEDLLLVCPEQGLQLDWQSEKCRVRLLGGDQGELADMPLSKSVFRAILARLAALCNERVPNSVTPYGGQGELPASANPSLVINMSFVNTPGEQHLVLLPRALRAVEAAKENEFSAKAPQPLPTQANAM